MIIRKKALRNKIALVLFVIIAGLFINNAISCVEDTELSKVYDVVADVLKLCFAKVKNLSAGVFPI